jgi:hypothetical protein
MFCYRQKVFVSFRLRTPLERHLSNLFSTFSDRISTHSTVTFVIVARFVVSAANNDVAANDAHESRQLLEFFRKFVRNQFERRISDVRMGQCRLDVEVLIVDAAKKRSHDTLYPLFSKSERKTNCFF